MDFLNRLDNRDRLILGIGVAVLAGVLGFFLFYAPYAKKVQAYRLEVAAKQELLAWMEEAAAEAGRLRAAGAATKGSASTSSPLAVIDTTVGRFDLAAALQRVEPAEDNGVWVWFENAVFVDLVNWLQELQQEHGMLVSECTADYQNAPGLVNCRILLTY